MKIGPKPVHPCYTCRLNLGDHCWKYACPRRQWSGKKCPGFNSEALIRQFREWQEAPHVKSRRQLRREIFRTAKTQAELHFRNVKAKQMR